MELNSMGMTELRVGLLLNILAFLLCGGMAYFLSNLADEFTNLVMKGSLFLLSIVGLCFCFSWRTGAESDTGV